MSDTYENNAIVVAAVNKMLNTIAVLPVTNLDFNNANVRLAYNTLMSVDEAVQAEDWSFNYFGGFVFIKDNTTGKIPWRKDIIRIHKRGYKLIERDGYMFNMVNNSFDFGEYIEVDEVAFRIPFHELPVLIRNYIILKAAREFQVGNNGSERIDAYLQEQEYQANISARDWDTTEGDYNMFQNLSVVLANSRR